MSREPEQEELYNQFAQEWSEVERLAKQIQAKIGRPVEVRPLKSGRWGFYAPKNFAFARKIKSRKCLRTSTMEEWAIRAGIDRSRYCVRPTAFWGKPSADMCMNQDNVEIMEDVASILAKVCEARHR